MSKSEVIIIGSGPAGLTAAIYAARANLNPVVIGGAKFGGQLMGTTEVENFPGFPEGIQGPQLMQNMMKQAQRFGADIKFENATKVDFNGDVKKVWVGETEYQAPSVILAMGSSPRKLGIPGEDEYWGKGVSTCATCDGAFYKEKTVVVVGGGDSAMEEASFLTKFAKKVYVIHRRDEFKASKIMQERVLDNDKIEILWNTNVTEVLGDGTVNKIKIKNVESEEENEMQVDGFFLAIGHIPNTNFLEGIQVDDQGFIEITSRTQTNIEGVFVAGDVYDHHYQQAITAAGMGCMAAIDCERWLESR